MKLNINPLLFEQIRRQSLNESDNKMEMVKDVFDLLTSPDPQNVELAKQYLDQEYFQEEYMPYLDQYCIKQTGGDVDDMMYLMYLTQKNWHELFNEYGLDLSERGLNRIPKSIGGLTNLVKLDLRENNLTEIPETIGNIKNLRIIYLENNQLTKLPETIGNLKNLKSLRLDKNQLEEIPETIGNLTNLNKLIVPHNNIKIIPNSITLLINLKNLELQNNEIEKLPIGIGNLKKLEWIILIDNNISEDEKKRIVAALPNCEIFFK